MLTDASQLSLTALNWTGADAIQIDNGALEITGVNGTDVALGNAPASFVANNIVIDGGVLSDVTTGAALNANRGITLGGINSFGVIDSTSNGVSFYILGGVTGSGDLIKTGAGEVILAAANSYTGGTTVAAGVLQLQNSAALGSNAVGTVVAAGASLELNGTTSNGALTVTQPLTLNGAGASTLTTLSTVPASTVVSSPGALRSIGGNNTYSGAITLGSASQINSEVTGNTLTITGGITGAGFPLTIGWVRKHHVHHDRHLRDLSTYQE